jgi:hypothetical protein
MTKKIVAVLALSLVSSSAFASQAKNIVTGGGDAGNILCGNGMCGSFYTNDEYNIFWNPAFINGQKNWAIVENGLDSGTSAGFVTSMGSFNVGAFLNRPTVNGNGGQALDLIVGGDMGVKWGIGLTQTLSQDASNTASTTNLKAGVIVADFEPFAAFSLKDTADGTNSNSDFTVGTRYHYGEWTPYAAFRSQKAAGATDSSSLWGLGLGRNAKMGDVTMDYSLSYWNTDAGYNLPLALTFTADAASWLAVRAGFQHALRGQGGTTTTLGSTFKLGKADLDMVVGQNNGTTGPDSFGFTDDLFANAGLTYRW